MTYIPTTEEVRDSYTRMIYTGRDPLHDAENYEPEFYGWLRSVIKDAHEQGMAYEGCGSIHPLDEEVDEILAEWIKR